MNKPETLADFFHVWSSATPAPGLVDARHGGAEAIPAPEVTARVAGIALGLRELGVEPGDRVALLCGNRPEWHMIDMALQHMRGVNVSVYTTLLPDQIAYILKDCGAKVLIVDVPDQVDSTVPRSDQTKAPSSPSAAADSRSLRKVSLYSPVSPS